MKKFQRSSPLGALPWELTLILASSFAVLLSCAKLHTASAPEITYNGRIDLSQPGRAVLSWSGSSFAFRFRGTACQARLRGTKSIYAIEVDNKPSGILDLGHAGGDQLFPVASGLPEGIHEVVVTKRTEPLVGIDTLTGIELSGTFEKPSARPHRKIEFIGNSITCGYGNLDSLKEHVFSHHTEDYTKTYAALSSKELGAQAHAICWSGKGVYRNMAEDTTLTMPILWERTQAMSEGKWNHGWHPNVVVVDLGTNDYNRSAPPADKFEASFIKFLRRIRKVHPKASLVLLDGPMLNDFWPLAKDGKPIPSLTLMRGHLGRIADTLRKDGAKISTLSLTSNSPQVGYGADWHPSQKQHQINAVELTEHLRKTMGW